MADKRKTEEIHTEVEKTKQPKMEDDMVTNLPDSLQLCILSLLDAKCMVQTSALSKAWVSAWKLAPVLEFNSAAFGKLKVFDRFVFEVLRHRDQSANLESITFNRHRGACSAKILNKVLKYAFSHGVKKVEALIDYSRNNTWPITSSETLTSLKLESESFVGCPFLGPGQRSGSFKNLSVLYLKQACISDPEPFSRFPVLKKLTLFCCHLERRTAGKTLNIHAPQLTDLTISVHFSFDSYQLATPKLRFFDYAARNFPVFVTHAGVPVLDTVAIELRCLYHPVDENGLLFDELLSLFTVLRNAKSLTLFQSVVRFLILLQDELLKRESPFCNLNSLKFRSYSDERWVSEISSKVRGYFLKNSPHVRFT